MNFHTLLNSHFYHLHINPSVLFEFLHLTQFSSFCSLFFVSLFSSLLRIFCFVPRFLNRSKGVHVIEKTDNSNSKVSLSSDFSEKEVLELQISDFVETVSETEDSVLMINNSNKYEFLFGKDIIHYVEGPKEVEFMVQEMFIEESNEDLSVSDESEISLFEEKEQSEKETVTPSFYFKLFDPSCLRNEDTQVHNESLVSDQSVVAWNWDSLSLCEEDDTILSSCNFEEIRNEVKDSFEDGSIDDQDFSYEVELISPGRYLEPDSKQDTLITKNESIDQEIVDGFDFIETSNKSEAHVATEEKVEDLDDEFIELGPSKVSFPGTGAESSRNFTENEKSPDTDGYVSEDGLEEKEEYWDSDSDDDESEDALREHESLVQQIKMELRNCRVKGLPTISEESESFKIVEDLKPLKIDHKLDYKDLMADIHKFYKSYAEKMRKLDVLNYQTLQAISFLQLKESDVFKPGKKNSGSGQFNMSKIWTYKVQKIYADPMHKSIKDMQNDLELVYVGQLCLSWEILCWLYIKGQDLINYDSNGNHSYNRAAEEFQQFQVLLQRFMEDEPFQGRSRIQNYVRNRCMIRSLLQVPKFKDDCLKDYKERREEKDAISLAPLLETIKKSMLIFREFVRSDKVALNVISKGVQGTKVVSLDTNLELLMADIITNLQKKDRKIKENVRSQNCIVKKFKKHQEWELDNELFSQVELRMVSRVLALSRLTTDQLLWCQNKLSNISIVKRRVHLETSFLLFPC